MIVVSEFFDLLRNIRPLADEKDELRLTHKNGELQMGFVNDCIDVMTSIDDETTEDFSDFFEFKSIFEVLRNTESEYVTVNYNGDLELEFKDSKAEFLSKNKMFSYAGFQESLNLRHMFDIKNSKFKDILASLIKLSKDSEVVTFKTESKGVNMSLEKGEYKCFHECETDEEVCVSIYIDTIKSMYKVIKKLEDMVSFYTNGSEVYMCVDCYYIKAHCVDCVEPAEKKNSTYLLDVVTDDILEAVRIASKLNKYLEIEFGMEIIKASASNKATNYSKEILSVSDVPVGTKIKFEAIELLELLSTLEDDYTKFYFSSDLKEVYIENEHKKGKLEVIV